MYLKRILPLNLFEAIDRAGISSTKEIMILSILDIKRLTRMHSKDIQFVKNIVSDHISAKSFTCRELLVKNCKISTGCSKIDDILGGGFRTGTINEIFGESGSGKTQLVLYTSIHNLSKCSVYICTEDLFPAKRFNQIMNSIKSRDQDYGKNVFVEHISEAKDLQFCIRMQLPKLLQQNIVSLIVIDSIAAPFRVESTDYVQRAGELRELAIMLITLAQQYNIAIVCINQVTASFADSDSIHPALGLAWSNMVSTRLRISKTTQSVIIDDSGVCKSDSGGQNKLFAREISVVFAPDLANSSTLFTITSNGIQSID